MRKILAAFVLIYFITLINDSFAQCSDAGICSIGGHAMEEETTTIDLSLGYSYGYSGKDDDISYSSIKLSGVYHFTEFTKFNFVMPYNFQSGPLGSVNGIGDLIVSLSHGFIIDASRLTLFTGMKFSTSEKNSNLPQAYQNGFGSNDILFGLDYAFSNLTVGVGYQIAGGENDYGLRLKRGDDFLLRAGYYFSVNDLSINPQILFIKRLGKSTIYYSDIVAQLTNERIEVENSDQTQLNLLVNTSYQAGDNYSLFFEAAVPFLKRENNIDGLKRAFTLSAGINFSF